MIKVKCEVPIKSKIEFGNEPKYVIIQSHWNDNTCVSIKINDDVEVVVHGRDIIVAVENAMKSNRHGGGA